MLVILIFPECLINLDYFDPRHDRCDYFKLIDTF